MLYNTKVKGLVFRFHFDLKQALVTMDVEHDNLEVRIALWEKIISLKSILQEEFLPHLIFEDYFILESGKEISRAYVVHNKVSVHNKSTWQETMVFFNETMNLFEGFYEEYQDILRD